MQQMLRGKTDVLSLAQGIVHWAPPELALAAGRAAMSEPDTSLYGADDGLPALREALKTKLQTENGLSNSEVMVTAGANQAYTNIVLTLMDAGDASLLFRPYYFNHLMALQMTGSAETLALPPALPDLQPDLAALRRELEGRASSGERQLKLVTLCARASRPRRAPRAHSDRGTRRVCGPATVAHAAVAHWRWRRRTAHTAA
jgi:aspartate/methionine/tyrosine aminotransferase